MRLVALSTDTNPDALPQLMGDFKPVDEWQAHISQIFYGLRGGHVQDYYQTFASADYRLAHALAQDYYERVRRREAEASSRSVAGHTAMDEGGVQSGGSAAPLVIHEWGPGNGNLAACFLTHLKQLDAEGLVYPRVRYVLVDAHQALLERALSHPDLVPHRNQVEALCADVTALTTVADGSVDRIICNELWSELPTKLMLRKGGDFEEEYLRPNLSERRHAEIADWSGFLRAFEHRDLEALRTFPAFLEDIIWEKDYHKVDWTRVPYRKTITEFLRQLDEHVLVPVNLGAMATLKEAKRLLAEGSAGFSSFDAGAVDVAVLNDPERPCYGLFGGQYSFIVNFPLLQAVAAYLGFRSVNIEAQRAFVGRQLGTNVISLMDLLATYPSGRTLKPWEQDRLLIQTLGVLNQRYRSPYQRRIEIPLRPDTPPAERGALEKLLQQLGTGGVPDTVAYLTEEEILGSMDALEQLGYERSAVTLALAQPPQAIDYRHWFCE
jgi:hypothetical protein